MNVICKVIAIIECDRQLGVFSGLVLNRDVYMMGKVHSSTDLLKRLHFMDESGGLNNVPAKLVCTLNISTPYYVVIHVKNSSFMVKIHWYMKNVIFQAQKFKLM